MSGIVVQMDSPQPCMRIDCANTMGLTEIIYLVTLVVIEILNRTTCSSAIYVFTATKF